MGRSQAARRIGGVRTQRHLRRPFDQLLARLRSGDADEICCTHEAMENFERARAEAAKKTVWYHGGCHSWYLDKQGIPASWPWTYSRFVSEMEAPDWEHYQCLSQVS